MAVQSCACWILTGVDEWMSGFKNASMSWKVYKYCVTILLLAVNQQCTVSAENFTVGYLTNMRGRNIQRQGLVISGAISYAIDKINNNSTILPGHRLQLIYNDTKGDTLIGTNATIHQWKQGAIAFFGPEDSCEVEATVAAAMNLPMISYGILTDVSQRAQFGNHCTRVRWYRIDITTF